MPKARKNRGLFAAFQIRKQELDKRRLKNEKSIDIWERKLREMSKSKTEL